MPNRVADADLARRLDEIFSRYVQRAEQVERGAWKRRGTWHKLKDHAYYLLNELM